MAGSKLENIQGKVNEYLDRVQTLLSAGEFLEISGFNKTVKDLAVSASAVFHFPERENLILSVNLTSLRLTRASLSMGVTS